MQDEPPTTYAEAGVDTQAQKRSIEALAAAVDFRRIGQGEPLGPAAGFAGLVRLGHQALAICTDGVGTKLEVAAAVGRWDTVGIDCIAMNVNDAICVGAEPLAFVDYVAIEKPNDHIMGQLGVGLNEGAKQANVTLAGGETAIMPEIVRGLDLAGTCVGVVDADAILDGAAVQEGDAIIGLASSGAHSNGYTLARSILSSRSISLDSPMVAEEDVTWGQQLLTPTRIYVRPVLEMLRNSPVHGVANITGGGLKNLPRINNSWRYVVDRPLPVPAELRALQALGRVSDHEMHQTFNMGMGMAVVLPAAEADAVLAVAQRHDIVADIVGRVGRGRGAVHTPLSLEYASKTAGR